MPGTLSVRQRWNTVMIEVMYQFSWQENCFVVAKWEKKIVNSDRNKSHGHA